MPAAKPLYAFGTFIQAALETGDPPARIYVTDDLTKDLGDAAGTFIASPNVGRFHAVGPESEGRLYAADALARTVTRYDLGEGDALVPVEPTLDLGSLIGGSASQWPLTEYGGAFQFISPSKAYYLHGWFIAVWNPAKMSITDVISFQRDRDGGGLLRNGHNAKIGALPLRIENELFVFIGWDRGQDGILSESAVLVLDTETDAVSIHVKDGCGYAREGVVGPDGKIYLGTEAFATAFHYSDPDKAAPPCMLRFDPVTKTFDEDFSGPSAGAPELFTSPLQGPPGHWFTKVLDDDLAARSPWAETPRLLSSDGLVYRWARVSLGDEPAINVLEDVPPVGGSTVPAKLDGRVFYTSFRWEGTAGGLRYPAETSFAELGQEGPLEPAFKVPGQAFSAVKLR